MSQEVSKPLDIVQGDGFLGTLTVYNKDGTLADISGISAAQMQGREDIDAEATQFDITLGSGISVDTVASTITFTIPGTQTSAANTPGRWWLSLTGWPIVGESREAFHGSFTLRRSGVR